MRHSIQTMQGYSEAGDVPTLSMAAMPPPTASIETPLMPGDYVVTQPAPLRAQASLAASVAVYEVLNPGDQVIVLGPTSNYFAQVIAHGPQDPMTGTQGWISQALIAPAVPAAPGDPTRGPNTPPDHPGQPDQPGRPPQSPPTTTVTVKPKSSIPWVPIAIGLALGFVILVEQKKKGGGRR